MQNPYIVSQGKKFEILIYATGPKAAAKKVADFRIGKNQYTLVPTNKPIQTSYKVILAGVKKASVHYYDIVYTPKQEN